MACLSPTTMWRWIATSFCVISVLRLVIVMYFCFLFVIRRYSYLSTLDPWWLCSFWLWDLRSSMVLVTSICRRQLGNLGSLQLISRLAVIAWTLHYAKRLFETFFVHKFSHGTMPLTNLFKNCTYYWGYALFVTVSFVLWCRLDILSAILCTLLWPTRTSSLLLWLECSYVNVSMALSISSSVACVKLMVRRNVPSPWVPCLSLCHVPITSRRFAHGSSLPF